MHEFGFYLDLDETLRLREAASFWWFKHSLMVFRRAPRKDDRPERLRRHFPLREFPPTFEQHPNSPHKVPKPNNENPFPLLRRAQVQPL
jgi:hypothetical protein